MAVLKLVRDEIVEDSFLQSSNYSGISSVWICFLTETDDKYYFELEEILEEISHQNLDKLAGIKNTYDVPALSLASKKYREIITNKTLFCGKYMFIQEPTYYTTKSTIVRRACDTETDQVCTLKFMAKKDEYINELSIMGRFATRMYQISTVRTRSQSFGA